MRKEKHDKKVVRSIHREINKLCKQHGTLVKQLIDPRIDIERGVDHSREGKILVQKGKLKLVWRGGGTYWSGMQGNRYNPSSLSVTGIGNDRVGKILHEAGRLSSRVIASCAEEIDRIFGAGTAKHIDLKKTLVLE